MKFFRSRACLQSFFGLIAAGCFVWLGAGVVQASSCACVCMDGSTPASSPISVDSCAAATPPVCQPLCIAACGSTLGMYSDQCSEDPPPPQQDYGTANCTIRATTRSEGSVRQDQVKAAIQTIAGAQNAAPATWTCATLSSGIDNNRCVTGGCVGAPFCCVPGTSDGSSAAANSQTAPTDGSTPTPSGQNCTVTAVANGAAQTDVDAIDSRLGLSSAATWQCRNVCQVSARTNCVTHGCPGSASILCCPPTIGIPSGQQCGGRGSTNTTSATPAPSGIGGVTSLVLPSCALTDGNCQLADLFTAAYSAVRLMFGLSGVFLLIAFLYSGWEYLIAGSASSVKSAKERMMSACIGILIMIFAYSIVMFLYNGLVH